MVVPSGENKTCQSLDVAIKPLNLYERAEEIPESTPLSSLTLAGRFSLHDAFIWTG
jgi:hypothetical protein